MEGLKETVTRYLKELGVPANIRGYDYLRKAIELTITDRNNLNVVCRNLYPVIATQYGVAIGAVERGIRLAIKKSMLRGNCDLINKIFGFTIDPDTGLATNTEYIAAVADYIKTKEV